MTLLQDTLAAIARLEQTQRRHGLVTARLLAECLPTRVRGDLSTFELDQVAKAINAALAPDPAPATPDVRERAAGGGA